LTSNPDWGGWFTAIPFAGEFPPYAGEIPVDRSNFTFSLNASFADMQTFARGANGLTLVVRGNDNRIIARRPFPEDILAQASAAATAGLNRLRAQMVDYRRTCVLETDLSALAIMN